MCLGSSAENDAVWWAMDVSAMVPQLCTKTNVELHFSKLSWMVPIDFKAMENLVIAAHVTLLSSVTINPYAMFG